MKTKDLIALPFKIMGAGAKYLIKGYVLNDKTGAEFAKKSAYKKVINAQNNGLLLDGNEGFISDKDSFQNVCVMARVGAGKTSRYIIPNVLAKARDKCSLVVNDPKGEVFEATSATMKTNGFNVIVLDPENPERSSCLNPMLEARDEIELEQVADILVQAGLPKSGGKDDFWSQGASRFVSLFIKCLKNASHDDPAYFNLHNLYYLFQNFGEDASPLDSFMSKYTIDPKNPTDETLWNEYKGLLTGNKEGIQSFVLNAITALKSLSNPNIAKITATSDIRLEDIRKQRTIIYLITPAQHAEYYGFFTSLFFRCVFNACMRKMPDRRTLPVYVLYDEFAHSSIPNFVSTANTIRGYRVSLSIILQTISQLDARYGKDYAHSIQGGFNTYITYAGADPSTAQFFEKIAGRVRERQKKDFDDATDQYREYNLMNAGEVRMIPKDEALIVSSNQQAIKLKTTPFFEHHKWRRMAKKGACDMQKNTVNEPLKLVSLWT